MIYAYGASENLLVYSQMYVRRRLSVEPLSKLNKTQRSEAITNAQIKQEEAQGA
jgi:hypothetical protein